MLLALATAAEKVKTHWFVMRAYKNEKKAEEELQKSDSLVYFIPKHYVLRTYHGVKSKRLVPVIPSLIFVRASHAQITQFKKERFNQLQFVMWNKGNSNDYMIVPDEQMENFMRVSLQQETSVEYYKPEEINFEKGTHVRIHGGNLDGVVGLFVKVSGKRNRKVVVMLEGVMAIAAEIHPDLIEVID